MRSARSRRRRLGALLGLLLLALPAGAGRGDDDLEALEALTDDTIRAACHGFAFDSELRTLQNLFAPDSSYCRNLRDAEPAAEEAPPKKRRYVPPPSNTDYRRRDNARVLIEMECEMEYHCLRQRQRALELGAPLSLADYKALEAACEGAPWCIEEALRDYPAEIHWPEPKAPQEAALPQDAGEPAGEPPAVPADKVAESTPAAPEDKATDSATSRPLAAGPPRTTVAAAGEGYSLWVGFANDGPARLAVGPFPVAVRCPDGSRERVAFGAPRTVEPGASLGGGAGESFTLPAGDICRGQPATALEADPLPPVVQPGIAGFLEQRATCPDGTQRLFAVGMTGDGERFVMKALGGPGRVVTAAGYDARALLAAACGGSAAGLGARSAYVAEGQAYLSADFSRFVTAWTDFCRQDRAACLTLYREKTDHWLRSSDVMRAKRVALLAGVVAAGLSTAACEQVAYDMVESSDRAEAARVEAEGAPRFSDPALQAKMARFEADYARFGVEAAKLLGEPGESCSLSGPAAYRALMGVDYAETAKMHAEANAQLVGIESTNVTDVDNASARVVSGRCGAAGPNGPAVIVGKLRSVSRLKSESLHQVTVSDQSLRVEGTWRDGTRVGPYGSISIIQTATFEPDAEGKLAEKLHDWAYLNERAAAPIATYSYGEAGEPGQPALGSTVMVMRSPAHGIFTTTVTSQRDAVYGSSHTYHGKQLLTEATTKNGRLHGWYVTHPREYKGTELPGRRDCYQNGEVIKALQCPST